jgi:Na+/phosphate symporter
MDERRRPTIDALNPADIDAYLISAHRSGLTKQERDEYEMMIDLEHT